MNNEEQRKQALDAIIRLSEELGAYDPKEDQCRIKGCTNHGWLTRIAVGESQVLCDKHYEEIRGYPRK